MNTSTLDDVNNAFAFHYKGGWEQNHDLGDGLVKSFVVGCSDFRRIPYLEYVSRVQRRARWARLRIQSLVGPIGRRSPNSLGSSVLPCWQSFSAITIHAVKSFMVTALPLEHLVESQDDKSLFKMHAVSIAALESYVFCLTIRQYCHACQSFMDYLVYT